MEQSAPRTSQPPASPLAAGSGGPVGAAEPTGATHSDEDRAFAAISASVERLDELGLATETGLVAVEPATTFEPG